MEMQEILEESPEGNEEEEVGEMIQQVTTQEEAEPDHYKTLLSPSENVYMETFCRVVELNKGDQDEGNARLYRLLCLVLTIICLILLTVVAVLGVKLRSGFTVCPGKDFEDQRSLSRTCNLKECQTLFPKTQFKGLACQQCARGLLTFGPFCFFLSTTRLTWTESQSNCSSLGGSLAIITNQTVQDFLTSEGKLKYWIGLRSNQSRWTWVNNNELQLSYWEEAAQNGDCAYLKSDRPAERNWGKASCQASTYFICQL